MIRRWRWLAAPMVVAIAACGQRATAPASHEPAAAATGTPPPTQPESPADRDAAIAIVARVIGTYAITDEAIATLQRVGTSPETIASVARLELTTGTGAGLFLKPNGQPGLALARTRDGTYYDEPNDIEVSFELPATGHVDLVVVRQGPLVLTYAYVDGK
ncbi:MAG TPA: hypothetical protein VM261_01320 [Kofleriaceae bacterium]|nr:hypothetical protein [Kofleriaceae bacterium]